MLTANHAMFLDDMLPWKLDPKKGGYTLDDHCYSKPLYIMLVTFMEQL